MSTKITAAVQSAYAQFNPQDYSSTEPKVPAKADAALKKFAGSQLDVAEFAEKTVDGKKTFAVYVPSTDSGDVLVVNAKGKTIADGTIQDGNPSFDWNKL